MPEEEATPILVTRYRPRGLPKGLETWKEWLAVLAPSKDLHAAAYGIGGRSVPIPWEVYRRRYLQEMKSPEAREAIVSLANRVKGGEAITLLCSSACTRESRCHRSLLKELIVQELSAGPAVA